MPCLRACGRLVDLSTDDFSSRAALSAALRASALACASVLLARAFAGAAAAPSGVLGAFLIASVAVHATGLALDGALAVESGRGTLSDALPAFPSSRMPGCAAAPLPPATPPTPSWERPRAAAALP